MRNYGSENKELHLFCDIWSLMTFILSVFYRFIDLLNKVKLNRSNSFQKNSSQNHRIQ